MGRPYWAFAIAALLLVPIGASAEEPSQPTPIGGKCSVLADTVNWTKQEIFVWDQSCVGEEADFNSEPGYGGDLDPRKNQGLPDSRILRPEFLETILLTEKYRRALTHFGVRIIGARFTELVDLRNVDLGHELWLDSSLFEHGAILDSLRSTHSISISGSKVVGDLSMNEINVDGDLYLTEGSEFTDVSLLSAHVSHELDLSNSKVSGMLGMNGLQVDGVLMMIGKSMLKDVDLSRARIVALDLSGANVAGKLDMNSIHVVGDLFMKNNATFKDVELVGGQVGGSLELTDAKVTGVLIMGSLQVAGELRMDGHSEFTAVNLVSARVGRSLDLSGSNFTGALNMAGLQVGGGLHMNDGARFSDVNLTNARIGGQLELLGASVFSDDLDLGTIETGGTALLGRGTEFAGLVTFYFAKIPELDLSEAIFHKDLDLTGTFINGELRLGSTQFARSKWLDGARLVLRNTRVDTIQDLRDAWPDNVEFDGFSFHHLGGFYAPLDDRMAGRSAEWFEQWLGRQEVYSPQPYEHLARILQDDGDVGKATKILYAGKERERRASSGGRYVWMTALKLVVGYGYHIERALYWALGFVFVGWLVLLVTKQTRKYDVPIGITYSFDMLLPLLVLRKKHYDIDLDNLPRRYFYVHKVVGYILASFLIVGLSGLTK